MHESRRLLLAAVISLTVLFLWQYFYVMPQQEALREYEEEQQKLVQETAGSQAPENDITLDHVLSEVRKSHQEGDIPVSNLPVRKEILSKERNQRITIKSDTIAGSISLQGARLDDVTLQGYHVALDKTSPYVPLLSPKGSQSVYFAELGWLGADNAIAVPGKDTLWTQESNTILEPGKTVTLRWNNGQGITFRQHISLDDGYLFTVRQEVENNSGQDVTLYPYGMINRTRADAQAFYIAHEGAIGVFDEVLEEITYDDLKEKSEDPEKRYSFSDKHGWIGLTDKYWMASILPPKDEKFNANASYYYRQGQHRYQVDIRGQAKTAPAGESIALEQHVFTGAKKVKLIDHYQEELNIPLFDRSIDYGWLYFLTRPMFAALNFFYHWLDNFGLAILLMTVVVKLLLFPMANKSYKSMARMRKFMPEMMEIKERYSHDRQRMNTEMMKFYQEKRINPMAGCLPLLIQMPIFFALYKTLYITIDMRHADFYGWINDLSAPDPTTIFNLFGLLPYDVPAMIPAVGIWPVLFAVTMVIQQKLSPPPTDPTQRIMMKTMPWIFLFLFAGFPAGLVIYWVWSNVLSILQQWVITRKLNQDKS